MRTVLVFLAVALLCGCSDQPDRYTLQVIPVDQASHERSDNFTVLDPAEVERLHPELARAFRNAATDQRIHVLGSEDGAFEAFKYLKQARGGFGPWLFDFEGQGFQVFLSTP